MFIMQVLVLLVPAVVATLLFEKFKGYNLSMANRVITILVFAFFINMICYGVFWLIGWTFLNWDTDTYSTLTNVPLTTIYAGIAMLSSIVLSYIASFLTAKKGGLIKLVLSKKGEVIISVIIIAATVIFGIIYISQQGQ